MASAFAQRRVRECFLRVYQLRVESGLELDSLPRGRGSRQSVSRRDAGVCTSTFALFEPLPLPARQWAPVTRTLPAKRNCPFLCDKHKISNGFRPEPFECSSESHEVLYGSVAPYPISIAFLAKLSEDHQPFDISYQTAQRARSQGPAVLPCLGTRYLCVLCVSRHFSL